MTAPERFKMQVETAQIVQVVASAHGTLISLTDAQEAWWEHSQDYCAEWLTFDSPERPRVEVLQALTKYRERHPYKFKTKTK
jgi:hypothetical protein